MESVCCSDESVDPTRARKLFTVVEQLWEVLPSMIDGCDTFWMVLHFFYQNYRRVSGVDLPQALTMQKSLLGKTMLGAATTRNERTPEVLLGATTQPVQDSFLTRCKSRP